MDNELIFSALIELGQRIEACGASIELTNAVVLCSDLRHAIGNQWNPADKYAEQRVLDVLHKGRTNQPFIQSGDAADKIIKAKRKTPSR